MFDSLGDWRRTHYSTQIKPSMDGQEVVLMGWIHDLRDLGGVRFVILRDSEGFIQSTLHKEKSDPTLYDKIGSLKKEYVVAIKGVIKAIRQAPRGVEVIPKEIRILNTADAVLPLDVTGRTDADLDTRLNVRVLDLRRPKSFAIFKIRNVALSSAREFLVKENFFEVNTPKIIASATEGGTELFPISYFEKEAFLSQSPQLYKEQLTTVFDKVYEIGPYFRAQESNTTRHLSETIAIDIEQAFATQEDVMQVLERLVEFIFKQVNEKCQEELKILERKLEVPEVPFERLSYDKIIETLNKHGIPIKWGEDIPTPAERKLGELYNEFFYIIDWPTKIKPFYIMPKEDDPKHCYSFDLMYGGLELASGGTRVHEYELLVKRLREQGLRPESFQYHLNVFKWGVPPHGGGGLGADRLVMVLTGAANIREVVYYPRDRFRLTP
ncbi:MAG: aspartate--tRNA(Asn) ligase [Euryarchaeota archaeon]|nr:aspartate--tRNA(Asn) ligase [Euryarchaeota archaeon]